MNPVFCDRQQVKKKKKNANDQRRMSIYILGQLSQHSTGIFCGAAVQFLCSWNSGWKPPTVDHRSAVQSNSWPDTLSTTASKY